MRTLAILPAGSPARNLRLLVWLAPFRSVTFSGAYLPLFLLGHGITPSQIIILEAIYFSGFWVMWELPSGWLSDKIGHARSIQMSAPFAALGFGFYGLSSQYWQFCIMEMLIGIAQGLMSGSDSALLHESILATRKPGDTDADILDIESRWQHRMNAALKVSYAVGALGSLAIVHFFGVAVTLVIDGLVIMCGLPICLQLTEVASNAQRTGNFRMALRKFIGSREVRAFMQLSIGMSTITYFAVWLTAIYYQELGMTAVLIGLVSFGKQISMIGLSVAMSYVRFTDQKWWILISTAVLSTGAFLLPQSWWIVPVIMGFDVIRTISLPVSNARMNDLIDGHYRASMHSVLTMLGRGAFVLFGLPLQWIATAYGIQAAMACASTIGLSLAVPALIKLRRLP